MPQEARAVPAGSSRSSMSMVSPTALNTFSVIPASSSPPFTFTMNVIEQPSAAAMLGIAMKILGQLPSSRVNISVSSLPETPAATDTTVCLAQSSTGFSSSATPFTSHGLTANTTMSAPRTASTLSVVALTPSCLKRTSVCPWRAVTVMQAAPNAVLRTKPSAKAPPMAPHPIIAIFMS